MKSYPASALRNIGLFGHGGTGKTSLVDGLLFAAGGASRLGRVTEGTSVSDYDPDEIKRRGSVNLTVVPIEYADHKINLLDTPGYAEFAGEVSCAVRAADCALVLVDAHAGIEVGSDVVFRQLRAAGLPTLLVVNKMDRENADFDAALEQMRSEWGHAVAPLLIPIGREHDFKGVVNVVTGRAWLYSADGKASETAAPDHLRGQAAAYREQLMELAAEADDGLTEKYLGEGALTDDELHQGLVLGIAAGTISPVVAAAVPSLVGVSALLDVLVTYAPSPARRPVHGETDAGEVSLTPDPSGPLAALVFKTVADPFVGRLSYFRVYSGTVRSDSRVVNARTGHEERLGQVYLTRGKEQLPAQEVTAGDIGAVPKLSAVQTGDTLHGADNRLKLRGIEFPHPTYTASVRPKSKADLDKLGSALQRMVEEDPSLHLAKDPSSGETLVTGLGEAHIQMMAERMARKFGVQVEVGLPPVAYRETITHRSRAEYKHKKQTGGHGQYGHVVLEVEPNEEQEFEFRETVVGGAVPKQFFPAVEKGVQEALHEGLLAGHPIVNIRVTLVDGSYHPVDSSEMAFKLAAAQAFKKAALDAGPVLLEPIMETTVTVPDGCVGDVMSDFNSRRARVEGLDPRGEGMTAIRALVPQAEMLRFSGDLRAMTQGRGDFDMEFSGYEPVPAHIATHLTHGAEAHREPAR